MKAILIFDNVNDLLFSKWDENFISRMKSFNGEEKDINITDSHHVSQLLSPIITSQRVMAAQFSNTYTSMQCKDNTTIVFDEWLDHVFMIISEDNVDDSHRELLDCKTLVQHICGQNINLLHSAVYQDWLSVLLESRGKGDSIPGASGVIGESGATAAALNALKTVSKEIKWSHPHYHLLLFVGDKMLALYSSRGCEDLMPPDLILLSIQCIAAQEYWQERYEQDKSTECENIHLPWLSEENSAIVLLCAGAGPGAPHSLHLAKLAPRIVFVALIDMELREVGVAVHMSSQILSNLRRLLLQRNLEMLPNTLDLLEQALKKTTDALRKNKSNSALCARLTSRMLELRKSCSTTTPLTPETTAAAMHTALETAIEQLKPDIPSLKTEHPLRELRSLLAPHLDFLRVKAMRYFSLESGGMEGGSLTLHKYVEEFPGLIHFIYIDRSTGRFLAPDMADCVDMLTPRTVRETVSRSMSAVREGYGACVWRRGALHVCAVRWYERRGAPARPAAPPHPAAVRALPPPGDICAAFYRCVPLRSPALCAVRWYERRGAPARPAAPPHPAAVRALPPPGDICAAFYRCVPLRSPALCAVRWYERRGAPARPAAPPHPAAVRALPPPGDICAAFYRCVPLRSPALCAVRWYERRGAPARPAAPPHPAAVRALPPPGDICAAFYRCVPLRSPALCAVRWYERRGAPARPAAPPHPAAVRALPPPGDICAAFYRCVPLRSPALCAVRWYERRGAPARPAAPPHPAAVRALPPPGDICAAFYRCVPLRSPALCAVRWYERRGAPARPAAPPHPAAVRALPPPGDICAAFYRCVPLRSPALCAVRWYERRGAPARPAAPPHPAAVRALPPPGDICAAFYRCVPLRSPALCAVRWYERRGAPARPAAPPHPAAVRALPPPGDICAAFYRCVPLRSPALCAVRWYERRGAPARPAAPPHPAAVRALPPPGDICAAFYRCVPLRSPALCAVRWYERRGAPARPAAPPHPAAVRALPPPGDICAAFYRQLAELAFPGEGGGAGVRELVCVHVGLLPAPTAVQQARRLAHAVRELAGPAPHDLL